jgi:hypothetical protein
MAAKYGSVSALGVAWIFYRGELSSCSERAMGGESHTLKMLHESLHDSLVFSLQTIQITWGLTYNPKRHIQRSEIQRSRPLVPCIPRAQVDHFLRAHALVSYTATFCNIQRKD